MKILEYKESEKGTELKCFVPMKLQDTIKRRGNECIELKVVDPRKIRPDQRKKYFATINDISNYLGYSREEMHDYIKFMYRYKVEDREISMSDCSVTEAREIINIVIEFAIENNVPLSDLAINRVEDIDKYLYLCLMKRICAICGKKAEIHHIDKVGIGRDRRKIDNTKNRLIALCRDHHNAAHNQGDSYLEKYKVYGIKLDRVSLDKLGL